MRNYMMERFLERISLSEYRDNFILKGGMLVAAMVGLDARSTMDLDAAIRGAGVNVEDIENLMSSIIAVPIEDGVEFQVKSILEQLHGKLLDSDILCHALLATASKRGTEGHLKEAKEVFSEVENSHAMQALWSAYRKKFSYAAGSGMEHRYGGGSPFVCSDRGR